MLWCSCECEAICAQRVEMLCVRARDCNPDTRTHRLHTHHTHHEQGGCLLLHRPRGSSSRRHRTLGTHPSRHSMHGSFAPPPTPHSSSRSAPLTAPEQSKHVELSPPHTPQKSLTALPPGTRAQSSSSVPPPPFEAPSSSLDKASRPSACHSDATSPPTLCAGSSGSRPLLVSQLVRFLAPAGSRPLRRSQSSSAATALVTAEVASSSRTNCVKRSRPSAPSTLRISVRKVWLFSGGYECAITHTHTHAHTHTHTQSD